MSENDLIQTRGLIKIAAENAVSKINMNDLTPNHQMMMVEMYLAIALKATKKLRAAYRRAAQ